MKRTAIVVCALVCAACQDVPDEDTLRVEGTLERAATIDKTGSVKVDYASVHARGEWWPCDLRMTATACVGSFHVNVYVSPPNVKAFGDEGGGAVGETACADDDGNAVGAYEILKEKLDDGEQPEIGSDLSVLVLIASDHDEDGSAALESDDETKAASVLSEGTIEIVSIGEFDDPVSLKIDGKTTSSRAVSIEMQGPTTPVTEIPTLEVARTCVKDDAVD